MTMPPPFLHSGTGRSTTATTSAFQPIRSANATNGGGRASFGAPAGDPRAAPQCSTSMYLSPHVWNASPSSVASFDRLRPPPHRLPSAFGDGYDVAAASCGVASPRCHPVAENKKYKTEMCKNMKEDGYCRFGEYCHYAHSEAERCSPSEDDATKDGRLLLPCQIMVSTGYW